MKRQFVVATLFALLGLVAGGQAEVIWDNFITDPEHGGFDGLAYFSSERTASVSDSWAADDADFGDPVRIEAISWSATADLDHAYTAEFIILDEHFNPLHELDQLDWTIEDTYGDEFGYTAYTGRIDLQVPIELGIGHYYYAVRLASETGAGRNLQLTTGEGWSGNGEINGQTGGAFQSTHFYYQGWPDWALIVDAYPGVNDTDFAYRLHGEIIPEPASLLALLTAGLLMRRR